VRQQTASFTGSFTDPGTADTWQVSWDFGDGNVIAYHPSTDAGALAPSHTYTTSGTFTVRLYVKDDDLGVGTNATSITVVAAALQGGNLIIGGTDGADVISLQTTSTPGEVKVSFGGVEFGRFIPTGQIIVTAGGGADQVTIATGVAATQVFGGAGNDTITGGGGNDTIDGGADNDVIDGNNGDDSLVGGTGNDTITGGNGNDTSRGGDGNDSIVNNGGDDLLDGGIGNDTLVCGGGADTASGGDGDDVIDGGTGNDSLYGGNDNDTISGGSGLDTIDGGAGNDNLDGQGDADIVIGGSGNDSISGGADRDILIGGTGADNIIGNADEDILIAGSTDHDANIAALTAIQAEWISGHTYAQRLANLRDGSGGGALNGSFFFNPNTTVHDDGAVDTLTGSSGTDWFLFNNDVGVHDVITDLKTGETASDIV
jgi:Ca2+-binding RTX toxin-like protein